MSSPSHRSSSPPLQQPLQPRQSRSPTTSMSTSTSTAATTTTHNTTPSKTGGSTHHHHHHHHLPVGHTLHSPAQSASGDFIQGNPEDAGGLHTSTSRGNILLPPSTLPGTGITTTASATPADLLSVSSAASRTPGSSVAAYSRPASPSSASAGAGALLPPSSPSMLGAASTASHTATATRSRPISPTRSRSPVIPSSPRSPNLKQQHQAQDADVLSMSSSTPQLDSSAVFERDVEFANDHLLSEYSFLFLSLLFSTSLPRRHVHSFQFTRDQCRRSYRCARAMVEANVFHVTSLSFFLLAQIDYHR